MDNTLLNIKILYDKMSISEKKVADFLSSKPFAVPSMTISQLAETCDVSEATIVRFTKRIGLGGYQQLRIAFAQVSGSPINECIADTDSPFDIYSKICNDIYCSLEKTRGALDAEQMQKACDLIVAADDILVFGLGNSAAIAQDASHKLFRLGLNAHFFTDNHMQAIAASHTSEKSLLIGISHSGRTRDIVEAIELGKQNGAKAIAITNFEKSPISKVCDAVLYTASDETNYRILGLSSRHAQMAIVDSIYSYLVCHLPQAKEYIFRTESAVAPKRYPPKKERKS